MFNHRMLPVLILNVVSVFEFCGFRLFNLFILSLKEKSKAYLIASSKLLVATLFSDHQIIRWKWKSQILLSLVSAHSAPGLIKPFTQPSRFSYPYSLQFYIGHGCILQLLVSDIKSSAHGSPCGPLGGGLVQVLVRRCTPPPQDAEQGENGVHSENPPSTPK